MNPINKQPLPLAPTKPNSPNDLPPPSPEPSHYSQIHLVTSQNLNLEQASTLLTPQLPWIPDQFNENLHSILYYIGKMAVRGQIASNQLNMFLGHAIPKPQSPGEIL